MITKEHKDLANLAQTDRNEVWKKFKSLSEPKSSKVILEIIREDMTITTDIKEILNRWHKDISGLFSGLRENPDLAFNDQFLQQITELKSEFEAMSNVQQLNSSHFDSTKINSEISFKEVSDTIPMYKLRNFFTSSLISVFPLGFLPLIGHLVT